MTTSIKPDRRWFSSIIILAAVVGSFFIGNRYTENDLSSEIAGLNSAIELSAHTIDSLKLVSDSLDITLDAKLAEADSLKNIFEIALDSVKKESYEESLTWVEDNTGIQREDSLLAVKLAKLVHIQATELDFYKSNTIILKKINLTLLEKIEVLEIKDSINTEVKEEYNIVNEKMLSQIRDVNSQNTKLVESNRTWKRVTIAAVTIAVLSILRR